MTLFLRIPCTPFKLASSIENAVQDLNSSFFFDWAENIYLYTDPVFREVLLANAKAGELSDPF